MHLVAKARLRKALNDFNWSLLASIREGHWGENKVVIPADRSEKVNRITAESGRDKDKDVWTEKKETMKDREKEL